MERTLTELFPTPIVQVYWMQAALMLLNKHSSVKSAFYGFFGYDSTIYAKSYSFY